MRENICLILKFIGIVFATIYIATWDKTFGWLWIGFVYTAIIFEGVCNWIKRRKDK